MRDGHRLEHQAYCDATRVEVADFAELLRGADLDTPVPTCPEWNLADLVDHVGSIHRWAGHMVRHLSPERTKFSKIDFAKPDDRDRLPEWLAAGGPELCDALDAADPDAPMWAWGADQHVRFWSRRMLHETTVHRVDADLALGREPAIDDAVAVDGIDEFFENLASAVRFSPSVAALKGTGEVLSLEAPDRGTSWRIELGTDGFGWSGSPVQSAEHDVDATVTAPAAVLLLVLYGRLPRSAPAVATTGDPALVDRWFSNAKI